MITLENMDRVNFWPEPHSRPRRILVAMSGGVDSTFAAWILKSSGAEVVGLHFKMGDFVPPEDGVPRCCSVQDARDARRMADLLDIPFYVMAAGQDFHDQVILPFARSYAQGLTPNPCIHCNPRIKWRLLIQKARELGMDAVATGHHSRVARDPQSGRVRLLQAVEMKKEQSYFLARLSLEQLEMAVLPSGWFPKKVARRALHRAGLSVAGKAESQDICFVGPGGYAATVERYLEDAPPPGEVVDRQGRVLGEHPGIHHFTIGQRKGLSLPGPDPYYVLAIDPIRQRVIVGSWQDTFSREARIRDLHWIHEPPLDHDEVKVKVRYKSSPALARILFEGPDAARLQFEVAQRAVSPGQAAVIYRGREVLGSGFFAPADWEEQALAPALGRAGGAAL